MHSAIFQGRVRHRRFEPAPHAFDYTLFMMYIDLAEWETVFRGRWLWSAARPALAWLRRADHLGDPARSLDVSIRDLVQAQTGARPAGPIRLLTHLRYCGYCFNPVSFYFCFDPAGENVETVVAEVNNTPWGERHPYVLGPSLNEGEGKRLRFRFRKDFHVSPFMPMDHDYDWRFNVAGESIVVHMENHREGRRVFDATMPLERREIAGRSLAAVLLRFPFMTGQVIAAIYWQALRLWLKRIPIQTHPKSLRAAKEIR